MEEEDRISRLPEEIVVSIVSRLTLGDAVRTSVLSKRWRYFWAHSIRALNFDANEMQLKEPVSSPCGDDYSSVKWGSADSYNYSEWVSGVLAQHRGPNVDEFRVCFDLDRRFTSCIDGWIQFALSNRLHKLELTLSSECVRHYWLMPRRQRSHQPCYTLQHQVLMSSNMFVGFKSLKTLSLTGVRMADEVVEYFLSNCPHLERLYLQRIEALRNIKVVGASLLLRHLEIVICTEIEAIEICDTNLVSFTIVTGVGFGHPEVVRVKNSPQLVELCFNDSGLIWYMLKKFSCIYSQLQILQLTYHHGEGDGYWEYPMPVLENLNQFTLVLDFVDEGTLVGYLTMIKNWPNLERFVLQIKDGRIHSDNIESEATEAFMREKVTFCHPCLKVVEISGYSHIYHFYLFKQIIANAVALEKIILDTRAPAPPRSPVREMIYRELQSGEEQQLRGLISPRVKLVVL